MADRAVQRTDTDAAESKMSAVLKQYYKDELLHYFVGRPRSPRLPLINIGTYCRVQGVNKIIDGFLRASANRPNRAIVSLGAGSDTRAFHLLPKYSNLDYYELDFPAKTSQKKQIIERQNSLRSIATSERYHLIPSDLRAIDDVRDQLRDLGNGQPVLLISECCLCYLPLEKSDRVLQFFGDLISSLSVVLYEPMSLNDEFGRVMAENLAMRGLSLPTTLHYADIEAQKARLSRWCSIESPSAADISTVYRSWIEPQELARISQLEFLDEVEEMHLLLQHYCIAWGTKGLKE